MAMVRVVKYKQKNTYTGKDGKQHNYYGFALVTDNGQQIGIRAYDREDYARLDMVAEYVKPSK